MLNLPIQSGEHVVMKVRKHWFILLREKAGVLVAGIIPFVLAPFVFSTFETPPALAIFLSALWCTLIMMGLMNVWTNYFLDIWIVTDRRIMYIEQVRFFVREIITLRLERVQDATVRFEGFFETLLNFGSLRIQTAGAALDEVIIHGIPNPESVKRRVLEEVDRCIESHRHDPFTAA